MTNAVKYLDELKAHLGDVSDYRIGQYLGVTRAAVSRWRNGIDSFSPETAVKVAKALEIDPIEVVLAAQIDRAKTPEERALWDGLLKRCAGSCAALALAFSLIGAPAPADASTGSNVYYVKRRRICRPVNLSDFREFFGYRRRARNLNRFCRLSV